MKKSYFYFSLIIISIYYFVSYLPAYSYEYSLHAIVSDTAVFGLMAHDLISGSNFPWYYYGQNYMGPFTSMFVVLTQLVLNIFKINQLIPYFGDTYTISPFAIQFASIIMIYLGNLFFTLGAQHIIGKLNALILFLMLSASTTLLCQSALRPFGAEMAYFFAGLIFYYYFHYSKSKKNALESFPFGVLLSLSLWANQTVVFVWGAIFIYYFIHSELYLIMWPRLNFKNRLNLSSYGLSKNKKNTLLFVQVILFLNFLLGLVVSFFFGVLKYQNIKIPNGFSHIKSSVLIFLIIHFILEWRLNTEFKKIFIEQIKKTKLFILGFIFGQLPLLIAGIFRFYEKSYTVKFKLIKLVDYPPYLFKLLTHFFNNLFIGQFDNGMWPISIAIVMTLFFIIKDEVKKVVSFRNSMIFVPVVSICLNIIYIFLAERSREQYGLRYGILMLPLFYLLLVNGFSSSKKYIKIISCSIFLFLFYKANIQRMAIIRAVGEGNSLFLKEIKHFQESNYKTCFADYNDSYRMEFLTGRHVLFVPINSQDRTPSRSKILTPSTKCYYIEKVISEK